MAYPVLRDLFKIKSKELLKFSWRAFARILPQLEQAGLQFFYRIDPSLSFPAREIAAIDFIKQDLCEHVNVTLNFMGLQGSSTPLPIHYTELIIQDDPDESSLNEFYNFFNQRFFKFLLSIQSKYAYLPQVQKNYHDPLTRHLLSFSGLSPESFTRQEDYFKILPFSHLLLGRQLSQSAWCHLIQHYFVCEQVWLKQWVPFKVKIPDSYLNRLGSNIQLGHSCSLGAYVTQAKSHAEVHLLIEKLDGFLPHEAGFQALKRVLQWVTPEPIQFSIVLHVKKGNPMHLTSQLGLYLGWNSLLSQCAQPEMEIYLKRLLHNLDASF